MSEADFAIPQKEKETKKEEKERRDRKGKGKGRALLFDRSRGSANRSSSAKRLSTQE